MYRKLNISDNVDIKTLLRDKAFSTYLYNDSLTDGEISKFIISKLRENPIRLSAELNSLIKLLKKIDDLHVCKVFLISSNSTLCKVCSQIISKFIVDYLKDFVKTNANIEVIGILTIPDISQEKFDEALQKLADGFVREAYKHLKDGFELYTIITGGLKIEIAYITVLSFIVRSRIVYCPDPDSSILILPPLPIDLSQEVLEIYEKINRGESVDNKYLEKLVEHGLAVKKNGRIALEKWINKLIEARKWNSTYL